MPWCPSCSRYLSPPTLLADGSCPSCGAPVESARAGAEHEPGDDEPLPPVPWHLKLLSGALAVYLGYRAWQGIDWLLHRL